MVGEGVGVDQIGTERAQGREEFLRPADPGESEKAHAGESPAGDRRQHRPQHRQLARDCLRVALVPQQHDGIGARQPAAKAFAQRPGRDHPPVAEAVIGVDHDQRQILFESRVLEPVVEQDRASTRRGRGAGSGGPVARDPAGRMQGQQQRLVADCGGVVAAGINANRTGEAAAVTARH